MPRAPLVWSVRDACTKPTAILVTDELSRPVFALLLTLETRAKETRVISRAERALSKPFSLLCSVAVAAPVTSSMSSNHPLTMSLYTGPAAYCRQPRKGVPLRVPLR